MEINNSFYEKRNVFFRLAGDGDYRVPDRHQSLMTVIDAYVKHAHNTVSLRFLAPLPRSKYYKGSWEKLIFGSPFEKVGGLMTAKFVDPLDGPLLQSNLSSNTLEGQVKVTSRLSSWGEPLDPLTANYQSIFKFIARWTHVGTLSAPRIVKEALRVRFRGNLTYLQRPEVRVGSIPRRETEVERSVFLSSITLSKVSNSKPNTSQHCRALEKPFRMFLSILASSCSFPVSIKYIPPKSLHFDHIMFHSQSVLTSHPPPILTIQPLTPRFYTFFSDYEHPEDGLTAGLTPCPTNSDQTSCLISVSDRLLMNQILSTARQSVTTELLKAETRPSRLRGHNILQAIIIYLRPSQKESFMDRISSKFSTPSEQWSYKINAIHYQLARKLPVESQAIIALCFLSLRMVLFYGIIQMTNSMCLQQRQIFGYFSKYLTKPMTLTLVYGGWDMLMSYIGKYHLNPFAWGEGL